MKHLPKYSAISLVVLIALMIGLLVYFARDLVAFEILQSLDSSDGSRVAIHYRSDGGATTTLAGHVAIVRKGKERDYRKQENRVLTLKHDVDVLLTWKEPDTLLLRLPDNISELDFIIQNSEVRGVRIEYAAYDHRIGEFDASEAP